MKRRAALSESAQGQLRPMRASPLDVVPSDPIPAGQVFCAEIERTRRAQREREDVIAGEAGFRSHARIRMLNQAGVEVAAWTLSGAWPSKVSGPELNADGNEVAIESIVLFH